MDSNEMITLLSQILDEKIGMVTAYAYAKSKGYSGSADDFANDMANIGVNISAIETAINTFNNQTVPNAETAITTAGSNQVTAVNTAGQEQLQNVTAEGGRQVGLVAAAGTAQTEAVNTAGTTQTNAVNTAGSTQVSNVNNAGSQQIAAIQQKGEETKQSIPSDYTTLSQKVSDVKNSVSLFTGDEIYEFISGYYIQTNQGVGGTVDLTPGDNANYEYVIIDCTEGDTFQVMANGATTARMYAFIDSANKILEVAPEYAEAHIYTTLTAPTNTAKLIVNNKISQGESSIYKTPTIEDKVNNVSLPNGAETSYSKNATSGQAYDTRSNIAVPYDMVTGKKVKFIYECSADIFPTGAYILTPNGKYLNGSKLYLPNVEYVETVSASFMTGTGFCGLYRDASNVQGSGSVKLTFYWNYEDSRNWLQEQIDRIHDTIPYADYDLLSWGDSLTAGAGGNGTTYPSVCAFELGLTVRNCGVGGETANTISARQGGNNVVIPAGAINGTYSTLTDIFGTSIAPLLQGNGAGSASYVYINGEKCTITYSNSVYTISGYTGGASAVPMLGMFEGSNYAGSIVTIWVGANGSRIGTDTSVTARMAIIDSMIKHIGHNRYVVFTNWKANGVESDFTADDAEMLMHYGNKLFPVRKMLVDYGLTLMGITPTAQDTTDIANGTIPTSLRSDSVHLNANGYTAVGKFLADKIRSLGYVD